MRICVRCNNEIGREESLCVMDDVWHVGCYRCYACDQKITSHILPIYDGHLYHKSCYRNLYHPKCDVCQEIVSVDYEVLPVWMLKSCLSHQYDGTHHCFSCYRREPRGANNFSRFGDRGMICPECLDTAITDTDQCQPLYRDIQNFYKSLNMEIVQKIPLLLVDRAALPSNAPKKHGYPFRETILGRCFTKVETVQRNITRLNISILILKGHPRILTGLYLAHEMMHAWLRLNGYVHLDLFVEEGICEVMSYLWLNFESMCSGNYIATSSSSSSSNPNRKGQRSLFERKLAEAAKWGLLNQRPPIYRDGFKAGHASVLKYGLKSVLGHIKLRGSFPC